MIRTLASVIIGSAIVLVIAFVFLTGTIPARAGECRGQIVTASWYGTESGSRTANGERFTGNDLTAAHRSLPFGTKLRVTYRGKSVVVRVNDRGPYIKGRTLDLSKAVARSLGTISAGVVTLCMERV